MMFTRQDVMVRGQTVHLLSDGEGPPLLFLHGAGAGGRWLPFQEHAARRFTVFSPSHPGPGGSPAAAWIEHFSDLAFHYLDLLDVLDLERVVCSGLTGGTDEKTLEMMQLFAEEVMPHFREHAGVDETAGGGAPSAREEPMMERRGRNGASPGRRTFLRGAGLAAGAVAAAGLEGILAARGAPAHAQGTKIQFLHWADFIPEGDVELKRQAAEASKLFGTQVTVEHINANDLQARITAAIQSGAGPDVIQMLHNWPHLYASALADVSDLAEWKGKDQGGYYEQAEAAARDGTRWLALPYSIIGAQVAYRKSFFEEVGQSTWPRTYEELRLVGAKLKRKGRPIGQTLGHTFGDAPAWCYPLLWAYGGAETDRNGRTVIESPATVESVRFMQALWKDACDEGGLAWDDTNNNRAFHAGEISATLNGASIFILAKRQPDKIRNDKGEPMWRDILHGPLPRGPAGTAPYHLAFAHGLMKYSRNQKLARAVLKWLHSKAQYSRWFEVESGYSVGATRFWETHPMWNRIDDAMKGYRTAARGSRMFGYAGPPSAKATEAYSKYIVTDMYAKAVQGMKAEDAVRWAAGELKKIYG